jgi:hypothetical protein
MLCRLEGDDEIALPFDALNYRVFAFASIAKGPNVSFGSKASFYSPAYSFPVCPDRRTIWSPHMGNRVGLI